ncbi:hypothetical protein ATK36_0697 [Amycolatopsis sulphurea]|uniref:Chitin binding peritrophin-A-like protein n=1 Tax=Amycolatopsis sulphurea TaxID=76022 RepID=A0A2A9G314_9PSEU|nr:hypothetical protein ATK36_0697 [Amycolatopsis sulphurea]
MVKVRLCGMILAAGLMMAGCGGTPVAPKPSAPPGSPAATSVAPTSEPTVPTTTPTTQTKSSSVPAKTSRVSATATAAPKKTTARKTPTRKPPQYGYQCRDGDEAKYKVCAEHKSWVDGQVEFADCLDSGGTWDEDKQRCVHS